MVPMEMKSDDGTEEVGSGGGCCAYEEESKMIENDFSLMEK